MDTLTTFLKKFITFISGRPESTGGASVPPNEHDSANASAAGQETEDAHIY